MTSDDDHETRPSAEIIDLRIGPRPDGAMVFSHVGVRWRNAEFERRRAAEDTKRIEVEQAGKERL